jgi:hypothetical protein
MKNIEQYKIFDWLGNVDLNKLSKKEAKNKFSIFIKNKDNRINELKKIVEPNLYQNHLIKFSDNEILTFGEYIKLDKPKKMNLDYSLKSIQALSDWITEETIAYRKEVDTIKGFEELDIFDLSDFWKSVATDITIYYMETLKHNFDSNLKWVIQNEKVMDRNYPAIAGWKNIEDYGDGILFHILIEIYLLIYNNREKEDFIIRRLNYHMEDLL